MIKTNKNGILAIAVVAVVFIASIAAAIVLLQGQAIDDDACEGAITVVDDRGKIINFTAAPQRIVSLGSSFTEIIIALNESDRLVGLDQTSAALPGVPDAVENLGVASQVPMESLLNINPDCVLIWNFPSYANTVISDMERMGIKVIALYPTNFQSTLTTIKLIGTMMGSDASALVADMQDRVDAILEKTSNLADDQRTRVYLELGSKGYMGKTVGNNTLSSEIIYLAGGVNIFADMTTKYFEATTDQVLIRQPNVIVVEETSINDNQYFKKTYAGTPAADDNRIHRIDAGTLTTSPRMVDALEDLASWLHPELFS